MSIIQEVYPFDITAGTPATSGFRRWAGSITWTRDTSTQIVEITLDADLIDGFTNNGLYVYWEPARAVEFRPEAEVYPYVSGVSLAIQPDGLGYAYLGSGDTHAGMTYRYVTGAPIVEEELPPTGSFLGDVNAIVAQVGVAVYPGYAPSGAALPYVVTRPLDIDTVTELAINGDAVDWDVQIAAYCVAAGVEASFNLALAVIGTLQGARMRGTTLSASMGYNGAEVEGNYESQITVQLNQGGF